MPISTRSKTRSEQPSDLVTSPRDGGSNRPRRVVESRQGQAVVVESRDEGSPSTSDSTANGNHSAPGINILKCKSKRCLTCPKLKVNKTFESNITQKTYQIINHSRKTISCHTQNLVYLLTCDTCNIQYVGETVLPLHKRINIHRKAKTGCEHMIKHYKEDCVGSSFSIQVLEVFPGSGYVNNKVCPIDRAKRLEREDYWMKILRTKFPYGLNERQKNNSNDTPVGCQFPPIPRSIPRSKRNRDNVTNLVNDTVEDIFQNLYDTITNNIKSAFYNIRVLLNRINKKHLKKIASEILHHGHQIRHDVPNQIYLYILDIIDTKLYKPNDNVKNEKQTPKNVCVVNFNNKAMESIRLQKIFKDPNIIKLLPNTFQKEENIPTITYKLGKTIRNDILNYKEAVNSIYTDDEASYSINTDQCDCETSIFCDPDHKHVITGDLRLVKNNKLRKLMTKGPNYREPRSLNFSKAFHEISDSLTTFIRNNTIKYNMNESDFQSWKESILKKVRNKINDLRVHLQPKYTKPVLCDIEVKNYLAELHQRFVIVTVDKASNNFAFICRKYYISKLLSEVGYGNTPSQKTYSQVDISKEDIINANINYCKKFDLDVTNNDKTLPIMYWLPKMHKTPVGARFIVASKNCSTKPLSNVVSKVFKMLFSHVQSFHKRSHFYSSFKKFWVVQNSFPIIDKLNTINTRKKAQTISTFDFSTLYTTIPHNLLAKVLFEIVQFVFKSKVRSRLGFSNTSIYWTSKGCGKRFFTEKSLTEAVTFLIKRCYFTIGNLVYKQDIGIPMGIDPAPFWANLFLYFFESKYVQLLISKGSPKAYKFNGTSRFIDDLCAINDDDEFSKSFKNIYPKELELKIEHQGDHATFLDLDIKVEDGVFVYKLFDKRDTFPFFIVRMPHFSSNIPSSIFYASAFSEFLRIARCTLRLNDFIPRASELFSRMILQGGHKASLSKQIRKGFNRYPELFNKYHTTYEEMINMIINHNASK